MKPTMPKAMPTEQLINELQSQGSGWLIRGPATKAGAAAQGRQTTRR
jgi:hypothetical protein